MSSLSYFEAVIVGGGIVGAACFSAMAQAGRKVLLLEKARIGCGATVWAGAVVRVTHMDQQGAIQAAYGSRAYHELADKYPSKVPFNKIGYLHFANEDRLEYAAKLTAETGTKSRVLSAAQIAELFPELEIRASAAIFEPDNGYMDPIRTTQTYADMGQQDGGCLWESVSAIELDITAGRISGVETDAGRVKADTIILAAGEDTGRLLRKAGLRPDLVKSRLIQVTQFQCNKRLSKGPAFVDSETGTNGLYWPSAGGMFVGLPTSESYEQNARLAPMSISHAAATKTAAIARFGWMRGARALGGRCRTDAYSDQPNGLIGQCPDGPDGLLLATGFNGGGYKMAPYAAASVSAMVAGRCLEEI